MLSKAEDGNYDESAMHRCRPGFHEFMCAVHQHYDVMVWSASKMSRILTLLQQLGVFSATSVSNSIRIYPSCTFAHWHPLRLQQQLGVFSASSVSIFILLALVMPSLCTRTLRWWV